MIGRDREGQGETAGRVAAPLMRCHMTRGLTQVKEGVTVRTLRAGRTECVKAKRNPHAWTVEKVRRQSEDAVERRL